MIMEPPEVIHIRERTVGCDGGGGALGHPLVYLNLGEEGHVDCPYCGRRYILEAGAKPGGGH